MPQTSAQRRATAKYVAKNYDRIEFKVLKGNKDIITDYCAQRGMSVNSFITELVRERLAADGVELITRPTNEE